jgi:hypothetical protein
MNAADFIRQCCSCHAIFSPVTQTWAPYPERLPKQLNTTHGYCEECVNREYAELQARKAARKAA